MASKQLGKLRQWAGEVISSREKTVISDEFVDLQKDIELRRDGAERLLLASQQYHHALQKKKECFALADPEKLLPVDSLGIVMITHGEEFPELSDFGSSLVKFGRAHCKVATLQEAYAVTFRDTFLASIEKFQEDIKEYEAVKKKLESRRLSYDAAISKLEKIKNGKKEKEKERTDAEDELEKAQARYEETTEDLRAHIHSIQETEIDQLRELTAFLDLEMNFVEQYLEVLKETKSEWAITNAVRSTARVRYPSAHALHRKSPPEKTASLKRNPSVATRASVPSSTAVLDSTDDEEDRTTTRSRRGSTRTRSGSVASKPAVPSRPSSRASRKRADSTTAPKDSEEKQLKEEKTDKDKQPKRMSMAGWASNAMGSLSGRGKKSKDFASLDDDENFVRTSTEDSEPNGYLSSGHRSQKSLTSLPGSLRRKSSTKSKSREGSPQIPSRILKPPSMQERKSVRALYDFSGSSDELSFTVGDEIVVLNEVLEGWWMGELNGKQGLFPTPYTEVIPSKPALPVRPDLSGLKSESAQSAPASMSHNSLSSQDPDDDDEYRMSDMDEEVYGSQPLSPNHSPFFGGGLGLVHGADAASITSTDGNDNSQAFLRYHEQPSSSSSSLGTRSNNSFTPIRPPAIRRSSAADGLVSTTPPSGKKAPPPPPPRRSTTSVGSPPIPARRLSGFSGSAPMLIPPSSLLSTASTTPGSSVSSHSMGYDTSPFESSTELSNLNGDTGNGTSAGGCNEFKQNPFKPKGFCSNCFQFHV
ncbi:hypothetical protein VKT23_016480 [Stygiomarasmius scandens]|uniref:BAR-domain-containing protein n=1 Tax=Marasmiellus scandens TaxID=2682957 RepID=A0ABR1IXX6_9AGAR